jgi:hypothetical protein
MATFSGIKSAILRASHAPPHGVAGGQCNGFPANDKAEKASCADRVAASPEYIQG